MGRRATLVLSILVSRKFDPSHTVHVQYHQVGLPPRPRFCLVIYAELGLLAASCPFLSSGWYFLFTLSPLLRASGLHLDLENSESNRIRKEPLKATVHLFFFFLIF